MENYIYINLFLKHDEGRKMIVKAVENVRKRWKTFISFQVQSFIFMTFYFSTKVEVKRIFLTTFRKYKKNLKKCNHCLTLNK